MGKRKPRKVESVDLGTPQRAERNGGIEFGARVVTEGGILLHEGAHAASSSVIQTMHKARLLDGTQGGKGERRAIAGARYEAAERLLRVFIDAGLHELKAVDFERETSGAGAEVSDAVARARRRFNDITRVLGPWMECLTMVVLHDKIPRSSVDVRNVCNALDRLCVEFGM